MPRRGTARGIVLLVLGTLGSGAETQAAADIAIRNARVHTVDVNAPWAEAVAIKDGRIAYVGSTAGLEAHVSRETRVIDAGGLLLLPGFIDSHNHIRSGSNPDVVSLFGATTLAELQGRIREFAKGRPDLAWIQGDGWNYSALPGGRLPTASDLEELTGGRPAYFVSYDSHTIWLNQAAMKLMGISSETRDAGVQKDDRGRPTGIITSTMGDVANPSYRDVVPRADSESRYQGFKKNLADAARFGITTIVDPQSSLGALSTFERARAEGHLKSRLQIALYHPPGTTQEEIVQFEAARGKYTDDTIRVSALKLYIDDVVEPHTAALLEPYADDPELRGDTFYAPEAFKKIVSALDARGFQLFIHAIGDRGIRVALDALEETRRVNGPRDSRHQLVHVELLSPADIPRFKELGAVACMQPRHCAPDITGKWAANVGPARSRYAWAFRALQDAGARLAFASDWDVSEMDPLVGIYTAVTRRGLDGSASWIPEQTVGVEDAVRGYTLGGAYANFLDKDRGSIEVGKYADLVLLSRNLFEIPPEQILDSRVVLTLVGGKEVYSSDTCCRTSGGRP